MIRWLLFLMLISTTAQAGIVLCETQGGVVTRFDTSSPPQQGCFYYEAGKDGIDITQYDAMVTLKKTVPNKYLKVVGGLPEEMTQPEKDVVDDSLATLQDTQIRSSAKANFDGNNSEGLSKRALAQVILNEINVLRALHSLPDRTLAQAKTAIQNAIDNNVVDE